MGAQHRPLGLHALWGLHAAGVVGGCPRGGGLPPLRGAPGVRRCPSPGRPSCGAGSQGSATRVSRVRLVRAWGPSTGPTACALAGWHCSLWGWRKGVPRGGACQRCEGRLVSGAVPPPAARPLEWAARVPRPGVPGVVGAGVGTLHRPRSVRPCGLALLAVGVAEGRPRGGAFHHCEGRLRPGAVPPLTARPLGRAAGVRHTSAVGAGVWVWEPNTVPLACMPCGGCMPRGWRGAVPGGGGLPPLRGAPGVRRCPSPGHPSSGAGSQGSATRVSRVRSVRAWGPSTSPTACALAGRRCSLWGWREGVPGGGAVHHC